MNDSANVTVFEEDMSSSTAIPLIIELMQSKYSYAQESFVLAEVFEQLHAREAIKKLSKILELISDAARRNEPAKVQEAEYEMEMFTIENVSYLCHERFRRIDWLDRHSRYLWRVIWWHKPFTEDVIVLCKNAERDFKIGLDDTEEFNVRAEALLDSFNGLERALAQMAPYQFYNRLISFIMVIVFLLLGVVLGLTILS